MPYVQSKAFPGRSSVIAISDDASPETWTEIGEVKSIKPAGRKIDKFDASNMESGIYKEFKVGMIDPGTYAVTVNGIPSNDGQAALETAFKTGAIHTWGIKYPVSSIDP